MAFHGEFVRSFRNERIVTTEVYEMPEDDPWRIAGGEDGRG